MEKILQALSAVVALSMVLGGSWMCLSAVLAEPETRASRHKDTYQVRAMLVGSIFIASGAVSLYGVTRRSHPRRRRKQRVFRRTRSFCTRVGRQIVLQKRKMLHKPSISTRAAAGRNIYAPADSAVETVGGNQGLNEMVGADTKTPPARMESRSEIADRVSRRPIWPGTRRARRAAARQQDEPLAPPEETKSDENQQEKWRLLALLPIEKIVRVERPDLDPDHVKQLIIALIAPGRKQPYFGNNPIGYDDLRNMVVKEMPAKTFDGCFEWLLKVRVISDVKGGAAISWRRGRDQMRCALNLRYEQAPHPGKEIIKAALRARQELKRSSRNG